MKEPKEEAERIIEMYHLVDSSNVIADILTMRQAKQCAILHVEGIIEQMTPIIDNCYYHDEYKWIKIQDHWQEVLQIIKDK